MILLRAVLGYWRQEKFVLSISEVEKTEEEKTVGFDLIVLKSFNMIQIQSGRHTKSKERYGQCWKSCSEETEPKNKTRYRYMNYPGWQIIIDISKSTPKPIESHGNLEWALRFRKKGEENVVVDPTVARCWWLDDGQSTGIFWSCKYFRFWSV